MLCMEMKYLDQRILDVLAHHHTSKPLKELSVILPLTMILAVVESYGVAENDAG